MPRATSCQVRILLYIISFVLSAWLCRPIYTEWSGSSGALMVSMGTHFLIIIYGLSCFICIICFDLSSVVRHSFECCLIYCPQLFSLLLSIRRRRAALIHLHGTREAADPAPPCPSVRKNLPFQDAAPPQWNYLPPMAVPASSPTNTLTNMKTPRWIWISSPICSHMEFWMKFSDTVVLIMIYLERYQCSRYINISSAVNVADPSRIESCVAL